MTRWLLSGVLALTSLAPAAPRAAAPSWTSATSAHFEIYATGSPKRARDVLTYFEEVHAFFRSYLQLEPAAARTRIIVFSGEAEYAPYRANAFATAFYQPAHDRDVIVMKDFDADAQPTIVHEFTHLVLGHRSLRYPPWLAEGLAEFFSTIERSGNRVRIGRVPVGRLRDLKNNTLLPAARLFAVDRGSLEYNSVSHAGLFYAESWAAVHMLLTGERYRASSPQFMDLVTTGTPAAAAFARVYGGTLADFDRDLRNYATRSMFAYLNADAPLAERDLTITPRTITSFDASLALAELLGAQIGRAEKARAAFTTLAAQQPDNVTLLASRGLFELRTGNREAARPFLTRAADGGSTDATVLAELARMTSAAAPERADDLLRRALDLAPSDPSIQLIAATHHMQQRRSEAALALLRSIRPLPADLAFEYFQVLANAQAQLGNFDEAAAAAAQVVERANSPTQRVFAEQFAKSVGGPDGMTKVTRGRLRAMHCDGPSPILEIETPTAVIRLVIDDRDKVVVPGGVGGAELNCGAQDRPVRVGFDDRLPPAGTSGRLRFLDLR